MPQKRPIPTSTFKKVVAVRLDGKSHPGYADPARLGQSELVDLLTIEGENQSLPLGDLKCIYFVREFGEPFEPARKSFLTRPRQEGLWVCLQFVDGDRMEGLVPNDLLGLLERGIQITPPDSRGNGVRLFVPRTSLVEFRVLGVVGVTRRRRATALARIPQGRLFDAGSE